jgi:hypothetical protein
VILKAAQMVQQRRDKLLEGLNGQITLYQNVISICTYRQGSQAQNRRYDDHLYLSTHGPIYCTELLYTLLVHVCTNDSYLYIWPDQIHRFCTSKKDCVL